MREKVATENIITAREGCFVMSNTMESQREPIGELNRIVLQGLRAEGCEFVVASVLNGVLQQYLTFEGKGPSYSTHCPMNDNLNCQK